MGFFQAIRLDWVAISFSRRSSPPRDRTQISCIGRQILYHWATKEAPKYLFMYSFGCTGLQHEGYLDAATWGFISPTRDRTWAPCGGSSEAYPLDHQGRSHSAFSSVQFSHSVVSDSLWPHGLQHARLPCPSPTPRAYSNSCPLSRWCHLTISSSVIPFSCLQSFPASGSFPTSQFFASGAQSIGASASASVLLMNIQNYLELISFRMDWLDLLAVQGTLKSLLQHHSSKASILLRSAFFIGQLSHPYMPTGKTIALTRWTLLAK